MAVIRSPYCNWRADPLWKRALRHRTAGSATAPMCAVLGHHKRLRLGKIKDLTGVVIAAGCLGQRLGAVCAICRQVIDGVVGIVDRAKGFPGCPFCPPAGFFDRSRKLRVRGGFLLSPSLYGGLLLFELISHRRRTNSTPLATSAPFSWCIVACCAASAALSLASRRILCDKSLNACLQDCNGRPIAGCIGGLLWNTETRLGRCHRRV